MGGPGLLRALVYALLFVSDGTAQNDGIDGGGIWDPAAEYISKCDFNDNLRPFCDWQQLCAGDQGDWIRSKHATPTPGTGPEGDWPGGRGYFIYQEASNLIPFDAIRLESPDVLAQGDVCVDFWYHMMGSEDQNQLKVIATDGASEVVLWSRKGGQGDTWRHAWATLALPQQQQRIKVVFEAVRGLTEYGDTAIDNVAVKKGVCDPQATTEVVPSTGITEEPQTPTPEITAIVTDFTERPQTETEFTAGLQTITDFTDEPQTITDFTDEPQTVTDFTDGPQTVTDFTDGPQTVTDFFTDAPTEEPLTVTDYVTDIVTDTDSVITTEATNGTEPAVTGPCTTCSTSSVTTTPTTRFPGATESTCSVHSDPHYFTFDHQSHTFMGTCTYTLSKLCETNSALPSFNVEAANEHRGGNMHVSYVKSVTVDVYDYRITLEKNNVVKVNGLGQVLPYKISPGIDLGFSGQYVVLSTDFGLRVKFDGKQRAEVTLPGTFQGRVCGMCGNYNGQKADDFLNPDGVMEPNSVSLGNSWQVYNDSSCSPDPGHTPNCTEEEKQIIESNNYCGKIMDVVGPFQPCHSVVDPRDYFTSCTSDLCELGFTSEAHCDNLQSYADACQAAGVTVEPWRNISFCSFDCAPHSHYEPCGTACPATCVNPNAPSTCGLPCIEGCVCDKGYILYHDKCVPQSQCGCWEDGKHYPVGSSFWADDTCSIKCGCPSQGSALVCQNESCPGDQYCGISNGIRGCYPFTYGVCRVHNDPHYNTFDKETHHFMGTCTYTLAKVCATFDSVPYFNIEAKNENRGNPKVSYVQRVLVEVYGNKVEILRRESNRVMVNKTWSTLPVSLNGGSVYIRKSGWNIYLETDFRLSVSYDTDHSVEIKVPTTFFNRTCGMCGNFNNKWQDDYMMPNGQQALNSNDLGASWNVDATCNDTVVGPDYCPPELKERYESTAFCGLLTSKDGPFTNCHPVINPASFFDSCVFDLCALGANDNILCNALGVYSDACQQAGVTLPSWRNSTFCGVKCPPNSHYNMCSSACPPTCLDYLNPSNCSNPCVEGCECNSGFVLSGGKCVSVNDCGCLHQDKYYEKSESFWQENCESHCVCKGNNQMDCRPASCGPEYVCKVMNGIRGCYPAGTASCHIYGDPHYVTFDGKLYHFQGSCNYTAVKTCKSSSEEFSLTTRNEHRGSQAWSALNSVALSLKGHHVILNKGKSAQVDGVQVSLPHHSTPGLTIQLKGSVLSVNTTVGLNFWFNGDHELYIQVSERLKEKLCGLCGTYNDNQQDDLLRPDGVLAHDSNEFGDSWRIEDDGWICNTTTNDPPPCDSTEEQEYEKLCSIILANNGPFKNCHGHIPPQLYFESCIYDQCASGGNPEQFCPALEAYASVCESRGIILGDWKKATQCEVTSTPSTSTSVITTLPTFTDVKSTVWEPTSVITARPVVTEATCSVHSDPHYISFDKQAHTFMGTCTYTLSKLCNSSSSLTPFNVEAANEHRGANTYVSYVKYVTVEVHGLRVTLEKQKVVKVNGTRHNLPLTHMSGLNVHLSGMYVLLTTGFGLRVKFDGNHRVEVTLPTIFKGEVCGICGNYNGDKKDDFMNPSGQLEPNSASFGNSWQVYNDSSCLPDVGIEPNCTDADKDLIQSPLFCGILTDPTGPFSTCHGKIDPTAYFGACLFDMCALDMDTGSLCNNLESYAAACQADGVSVASWRNDTFCSIPCEPNSHYEQCDSACPATCVNPGSPPTCDRPCIEGCVCDSGYLLYNDKCVPSTQCGCWQDGKHYQVGSVHWTDSTCSKKCRCPSQGGSLVCDNATCDKGQYCGILNGVPGCYDNTYGICLISGDPHYTTFDKETHHFMGICTYTLAKLCTNSSSQPYFNVEAKNEHRGNPAVSYVAKVIVDVYGQRIQIIRNEPNRVLINGLWVNLPASLTSGSIIVGRSGRYITVETNFSLTVSYDTDHSMEVKVPTTYFNQTCGMCGNFNNHRPDDYMMPNGQQAQNTNQFGNSWNVEKGNPLCDEVVTPTPGVCPPDMEALYKSEEFCGLLTTKVGPFKECHSVINPEGFFESCVFDLCAMGNHIPTLCNALESYADACQRAGVSLPPWRDPDTCGVNCGHNSHYNVCMTACPATCLDQLAPNNCSKACVEGCECDDGFVLSGSSCVPVSDCGCWYNNQYYKKGDSFVEENCESSCECKGNNLMQCSAVSCTSDEICKIQDGHWICHPASTATCHIYGDPHYTTFDGRLHHFQGSCNYTVTETCGNTSTRFSVTTRNEQRGNSSWTALNSVALFVNNNHIALRKNRTIYVNHIETSPPITISGVMVSLVGSYVMVTTNFGLELQFDGDHELFVRVKEYHKGMLCGLCGTYTGNQQDDFLTPDGAVVQDVNQFGNSWRVSDSEWNCDTTPPPPVICSPPLQQESEGQCRILTTGNGPFAACHPHISPETYFQSCVYDVCANGGSTEWLCRVLESYAAACKAVGVDLGDWKNYTICEQPCPLSCSFDKDFCDWTQSKTDRLDWIRNRGPTPTQSTGPSFDHTTGDGHYIYIDGSASSPGEFAHLISRECNASRPRCLRFWYHMYGVAQTMALKIYVREKGGSQVLVWSDSGHKGDRWNSGTVLLHGSSIHQVIIEGLRGNDYRSDVAVDDISITNGDCSGGDISTTTSTITAAPITATTTTTNTDSTDSRTTITTIPLTESGRPPTGAPIISTLHPTTPTSMTPSISTTTPPSSDETTSTPRTITPSGTSSSITIGSSTIVSTPTPQAIRSTSEAWSTVSSTPETETAMRSTTGTSTAIGTTPETSTSRTFETSTPIRTTAEASTTGTSTIRTTPETSTSITRTFETSTPMRTTPETSTTTRSTTGTSTIRSTPETSTTMSSSPSTSTIRSTPEASTATGSAPGTSTIRSTLETSTTIRSTTGTSTIRSTPETSTTTGSAPITSTIRSTPETSTTTRSTTGTSTIRSTPETSTPTGSAPGTSTIRSTPEASTTTGNAPGTSTIRSTPETSTTTRSTTGTSTIRSTTEASTTTGSAPITSTISSTPEASTTMSSTPSTSTIRSTPEASITTGSAPGTSTTVSTTRTSTTGGNRPGTSTTPVLPPPTNETTSTPRTITPSGTSSSITIGSSTIVSTPTPQAIRSTSEAWSTVSSTPETETAMRSTTGTSTAIGTTPETSTSITRTFETSTPIRTTAETSTTGTSTIRTTPETSTSITRTFETSTPMRTTPETSTTTRSTTGTSTIRSTPETSTTMSSSPSTSTIRSTPEASTATGSAPRTSTITSTPETSTTIRSTTGTSTIRSTPETNTTTGSAPITSTIRSTPETSTTTRSTTGTSTIRSTPETSTTTGSAPGTSTIRSTPEASTTTGNAPGTSTIRSTLETSTTIRSTTGTSTIRSTPETSTTTGSTPITSTIRSTPETSTTTRSTTGTSTIRSTPETSTTTGSAPGTSTIRSTTEASTTTGSAPITSTISSTPEASTTMSSTPSTSTIRSTPEASITTGSAPGTSTTVSTTRTSTTGGNRPGTSTTPVLPPPTTQVTCSASGDPHYNTFDNRVHHFMGNCTYMLAKVCGQGSSVPFFNVSATNEFRGSNTEVSYVKSVHVDVYSSRITLLKNKKVNVNGKRMGLPIEVAGGRVTIRNSGIYVLLQTDFRLAVRFDGNHYADVSVPQAYSGKLCGLCGNYNEDPGDDNIKPDGTNAKDSNDLGDSWILPEKNEICSTGGVGEACDPTLETEVQKDTACGIISDPTGIFKECHAKVPPQNFFKSCVFDMCATGGQSLSLCYALQAYAAHCTNAGVCVQWRNNTLCPISCPGGSRYESCGSRCPATCFTTATSGSCSSAPTEGCFCEEGFILSGDRCVPRTECGCTDVDNNYHQLGESWYTHLDCSERCTCNHNNTIACTSWKCGPQERCEVVDGVLSCHSTGKASCHVAGDPHYFTFDKVMHTFLGTCTYTLVHVCDNSSVIPLTISGKNEDRGIPGATYLREVYIDVYDTRVTLQKSRRTLLNNERVHSPVVSRSRGISIGTVGIYTVVETDFGMLVKFDGNQHLEISLPDSYHSKVCGMCGNYNGNSNDELLMPDGRLADNVAQFGNSWEAKEDNTAGCLPDDRKDFGPPCKAGLQPEVEQQCKVLLSAAFEPCHALVDPDLFIQTCVYDMCKYDGMLATFCAIAQAYVDACRIEGISIKWRNTTLCPLPCPTNSHYTDCASLCPPTCNDIYASATCEKLSDCVEGCVCDDGFVLSDDKCVPLGDCGCRTSSDTYYQVGESWITPHCIEKCQCRKGGKIKCNPYECEPGEVCILKNNGNYGCKPTGFAKCSITGDPHYLTFDGLVHHFQGVGTYTLVQNPADLPDRLQSFNIEGKNEKMVQNYKISYIQEIRTEVYGHSVLFRQKKKLLLDGVKVIPPAQPHEGLKIYQRSTRIYLETDFGLSVSFDGTENADITLPNTYKNKVEGLCGNFDGKHKNDFTRRDGQQVKDVNDFGESWKVPTGKATLRFRREVVPNDTDIGDVDTGFFTNCSESELLLVNSTAYCGLLVDQSGPFNACREAIDPDLYHKNCLFDMCIAFERRDIFCESLQQYALACQEVKVTLGNWRQDAYCDMACPPHSKYSSCMTACPATCSDMAAASECDSPCLEGCQCLPGYVLSDEDCVPFKECGCTYLNKYYKAGETFVTDDCSQTCTCTESSSMACSRIACRQGQTCTISNFTRGCFMLDPCLENPCQNGGECVQERVETDNTTTMHCRCRTQYEGFYCEKEKEVSIAIIIVGVIGAVVVLVFLVIGIVLCTRSRLRRKMMFQQELIDSGQDNSSIGTRSHSSLSVYTEESANVDNYGFSYD